MRHLPLFAAALVLAGCAGRPTGVLQPVAVTVAGATEVPLLVATTRAPSPAPDGNVFGGDRGRGLSFAEIAVSIPPTHKPGEIEWPTSVPADPARHFATTRLRTFGREEAPAALRAHLARTRQRHVLVFVHGYNNRFEQAVYRFAQIAHDADAPVAPVLFTWPSRGRLLAYPYDHESASFSRDALEAVLTALAREPQVREVSILAHSMGNWVTLEALRQMAIRNGSVPSKIANVMLAAPDVDVDVASTQIRGMGERLPRFTLFVSRDDRALAASRLVWGSTARLGAIDPNEEPVRSALERRGITVLDLTALQTGDALHHGKFAESPDVVRFIGRRLAAGQEVGGQERGLADGLGLAVAGTVSAVGNVAGAVVTAPIAVVDPSSRQGVGERLESVVPFGSDRPRAVDTLEPVAIAERPQAAARRR